jgi:transposase
MSLKLRPGHRIFVYREYTDMRSGFDKLSMLIREKMKARLVDGDLFLFLGKSRKRLKGLCYDGTGLILIAKRIEQGKFMRIEELEENELTTDELDWLLRGSVVRRTKFGEDALTQDPNRFMVEPRSHGSHRERNEHRNHPAPGDLVERAIGDAAPAAGTPRRAD